MASESEKKRLAFEPNYEYTQSFLRNLMDDLEKKVENMREQALAVEKERESILATLQKIQDNEIVEKDLSEDEKEDIEASAERLICRCLTVEVSVTTPRNDFQERALQRTTEILQSLKGQLSSGKQTAIETAKSYLNACSSDPEGTIVDHRFQGIVLECTVDDQKMIRKKLKEMINNQDNLLEENGIAS